MTPRSPEQCHRLEFERQLLARHMPEFRFIDRGDTVVVEGRMRPPGRRKAYAFSLVLPPEYPYQMPALYIVEPRTLWLFGKKETLNSQGRTHAYHTDTNGPDGCVAVCHTSCWDASFNCIKVLLKLAIWLAAYETHLRTGVEIASMVNGQPLA